MDPTQPLNIMPPIQQQQMQQLQPAQPTGILNGQQNPQGNQQLMQQAMQLMKQGQPQMQPMQPIPMAQPVGNMGIDPTKLLAAMQQNRLMNM